MEEKIEYDPVQEKIILRNMRIAHADSAVIINPYAQNRLQGHASWMAYFKPGMSPDVWRNYSCGALKYHVSWQWLIPAASRIIEQYVPDEAKYICGALMDFAMASVDNDIAKAISALDTIIKFFVPDYFDDEQLIINQ